MHFIQFMLIIVATSDEEIHNPYLMQQDIDSQNSGFGIRLTHVFDL